MFTNSPLSQPVAMDISPVGSLSPRKTPTMPLAGGSGSFSFGAAFNPFPSSSSLDFNLSPDAGLFPAGEQVVESPNPLSPFSSLGSLPSFGSPGRTASLPTPTPMLVQTPPAASPRTLLFGDNIPQQFKTPPTLPMHKTARRTFLTPIVNIGGRGYNPNIDLSQYGVDTQRSGFFGNIEKIAEDNTMFRKVIFTSDKEQLVVMSLLAGENVGDEIHPNTDQFFRIESGNGLLHMNNPKMACTMGCPASIEEITFREGDSFQVPAGILHNILAQSPVKLYTVYSPPQHPYDTVDATKRDAEHREGL